MSTHPHPRGLTLAAALVIVLGTACKQTEAERLDHVEVTEELTAVATVESVDPTDRLITLQREDGTKLVVQAGPEVRNFAQIDVGDELHVRYRECVVASLRPEGAEPGPIEEAAAAGRAEPGAKPGAAIGRAVSLPVTIQSIDLDKYIVVFTLPDGEMRAAPVRKPEARKFLEGLRPGDSVQLEFTESLAISIEEK